jgi:hypothetical protein
MNSNIQVDQSSHRQVFVRGMVENSDKNNPTDAQELTGSLHIRALNETP